MSGLLENDVVGIQTQGEDAIDNRDFPISQGLPFGAQRGGGKLLGSVTQNVTVVCGLDLQSELI